ncbi:MAG: hypothetical protein ACREPM_18545 [Gemmatimonadaceae bacterium]
MRTDQETKRLFHRDLPGGGFVAIDVHVESSLWKHDTFHGSVVVERRVGWRVEGHRPPVIATADGPTADSVLRRLLPTAQSNVAVGAGLLAMQRSADTRLATARP